MSLNSEAGRGRLCSDEDADSSQVRVKNYGLEIAEVVRQVGMSTAASKNSEKKFIHLAASLPTSFPVAG